MTDQEKERKVLQSLEANGAFEVGKNQMDAIEATAREFGITEEEVGKIYLICSRKGKLNEGE